jgi:hypothetical protein
MVGDVSAPNLLVVLLREITLKLDDPWIFWNRGTSHALFLRLSCQARTRMSDGCAIMQILLLAASTNPT